MEVDNEEISNYRVGELLSTIGSGLTAFGLGVYVYQQTGMAAATAPVSLLRCCSQFKGSLCTDVKSFLFVDGLNKRPDLEKTVDIMRSTVIKSNHLFDCVRNFCMYFVTEPCLFLEQRVGSYQRIPVQAAWLSCQYHPHILSDFRWFRPLDGRE